MLHPRFWLLRTQVAAVLLVLALILLSNFAIQLLLRDATFRETVKAAAPVAGVVIALLSLVVTALSVTANWRRQRREATITAWAEWSDGSIAERRKLTSYFGPEALTREQGVELVEMGHNGAHGKKLDDLTEDERAEAARRSEAAGALVSVLNGLERVSVGVQVGVYDLHTLLQVGGTTTLRQFQRAEMYVQARRKADDERLRQAHAYKALEYISKLLEHHQQREIDKERLNALRRRV